MSHFVIIGGGIIGSAMGLEIAKRGLGRVTILEKENALGKHASGRNSGVIHSGINQKPGSLKARMCVEGSRRLREFCRSRSVPFRACGTLVVARDSQEVSILEQLFQMGQECSVPDLRMLTSKELNEREPFANGVSALFSPTGAVVDSLALLEAVAEEAKKEGVEYRLQSEVQGIEEGRVYTSKGICEADHIINSAGLYADRVAHQMGAGKEYRMIPFRGEYMEVKNCDVRTMIYRLPDLRFPFLSIHLTRETNGRVLAGPSAVLAFGREAYEKEWRWGEMASLFTSRPFLSMAADRQFLKMAYSNAKTSFSRKGFLREVQKIIPQVESHQLIPYRAGIRAQMVNREGRFVEDILVEYRDDSTHILNAVSPGMTCSLAFSEHVVDNLLKNAR
ncbi:MAG: L-2-hydroxyglutarate oxidase [Deltaproteobacteria bacterium]|nr:L-2-hydroxyglutarate oxidase [Deltaproteobacteria bacterium]